MRNQGTNSSGTEYIWRKALFCLMWLTLLIFWYECILQTFFPAMTKIVGTLGPKSRSVEIISGCLKAGMSGIAFFSLMLALNDHSLKCNFTWSWFICVEKLFLSIYLCQIFASGFSNKKDICIRLSWLENLVWLIFKWWTYSV